MDYQTDSSKWNLQSVLIVMRCDPHRLRSDGLLVLLDRDLLLGSLQREQLLSKVLAK